MLSFNYFIALFNAILQAVFLLFFKMDRTLNKSDCSHQSSIGDGAKVLIVVILTMKKSKLPVKVLATGNDISSEHGDSQMVFTPMFNIYVGWN